MYVRNYVYFIYINVIGIKEMLQFSVAFQVSNVQKPVCATA